MKKVLSFFQTIENAIMVIAFSIMVCTSIAQVINRNFFHLSGFGWFEEAAVYSMIYMVLIGTEIGLRDGTQISVTAVVDKLHGKGKKIIQIIAKGILVIFSGAIFYSTIGLLKMQLKTGQTSAALHLPMVVPYAALTISFCIITLIQGATLILMIMNFNNSDKNEEVNS